MKKVDTNNGVWVNDDPATLTNGTPIDADVMNNIQDEISNVITDNGGTLDGTNHSQLSQTLNKNFAKLNSPTLTGIPLTSNPDGTVDNQIATVDYVNQKALQATVGFTPVQQSGGDNQGPNKIYIGADKTDSNQVRVQVDQTDRGLMVFQDNDSVTHGVDQIGFNIGGQTFAFRDRIDNKWRFSYTTDQIDAKAYIGSIPDGNNLKVSDIIWNSSSSLPALYYGTDNSVAYLATETWANTTFQPVGDYATLNQVQTFTADQTIQSSNLHINNGSLILANPSGDDVAIYTDIEGKGVSKNDLVVRTNSGSSSVYTTISNNGDLVSSVHGKAAFENRQNTFNGGQTVIEQSGTALLLTAPGSLTALEFGIDGDDGLSFIDFHCQKDGGAYTDYDARIIASGGSSVASAATLDFEAANVTWQGYSLTRISDFSFNKNTNGYIILPTGFIIQWGKVNPSGGTYNFPIAFPNAVFNIVSGNSDYQGQYADTAYAWSVSTSQFRAGTKAVNTGWATTFEVSWVAFGF
ncbi:gp53-like domain-containing protein [Acetobacter orientalis]|uniref:gp53-like domain-containing protein n=1 Tax=Acetobacter orientalis TaxID=146474 RepID=UPI0039ECA890